MSISISLGNKKYSASKFLLKEWLELEDIRLEINKAVEDRNISDISNFIYSYLSTAINVDVEKYSWYEVAQAYLQVCEENAPTKDFPILKSIEKEEELPWDYQGRSWYMWASLFSSHYGWNMEYIAKLDIDDALGLFQELLIDKQLEKEWEWNLSEIAYPYNKATKKSEYKPLDRPSWMKDKSHRKEVKKVKILKEYIPVGNVISYNKDKELVQ